MDIQCSHCNQSYHIPDHKLSDKQSYFICDQCGHKVVVKPKEEGWSYFRPLSSRLRSARDIVDGIYCSFNLKNTLVAFIFLIASIIILTVYAAIIHNNAAFFMEYRSLELFVWVVIVSLLLISYDTTGYLISQNTLYRLGHEKSMQFGSITAEIFNDLKTLAVVALLFPLLYFILILPVLTLGRGGILYGGFIIPLLIAASFFFFIIMGCKSFYLAFIALRSRSVRLNFRGFARFIAVENVNLVLYSFAIGVISLLMYGLVILFAGAAVVLALKLTIQYGAPHVSSDLMQLFSAGRGGLFADVWSGAHAVSLSIRTGIVIGWLILALLLTFIAAWLLNLRQVLAVVAVRIMEADPGRSINRVAVILAVTGMVVAAVYLVFAMAGHAIHW